MPAFFSISRQKQPPRFFGVCPFLLSLKISPPLDRSSDAPSLFFLQIVNCSLGPWYNLLLHYT
jgi:hypothetical protein